MSQGNDTKDPLSMALGNRVDNFVQIELQRRQFANRYTKTPQPGEPVADFQSLGLDEYQVYKPAWALIRPLGNMGSFDLYGTSLSLVEKEDGDRKFGTPGNFDFDNKYDTAKSNDFLSEYGTKASLRPKPGLRNLNINTSGMGLYSTITSNFKVFDRIQLNHMSEEYMVIGREHLIMIGYSDPNNSSVINDIVNLKHPIDQSNLLEKGLDSLEALVSFYSFGKVYAKIAKVSGFDMNFNNDDASFDITTNYVTKGTLASYKPTSDIEKKSSVQEILKETPVPETEENTDEKYLKYSEFIYKLRGYSTKYDFILPRVETLFSIGQEKEFTYTETIYYERKAGEGADDEGPERTENEERTPASGFSTKSSVEEGLEIKLIEAVESEKSLSADDLALNTGNIFPDPEFNFQEYPGDGTQLVFGIKNEKGKGNKKVTQSYIPWAVCEWIINNGICIKDEDGKIEKVLNEFPLFIPSKKVYYVPMKEKVVESVEKQPVLDDDGTFAVDSNGDPVEEEVTITTTIYEDDLDNKTLEIDVPASHENYIRSVIFPQIKKTDDNIDVQQIENMMLLKAPPLDFPDSNDMLFDEEINGGKFVSTTVDVPTELFSISPDVCLLPQSIPTGDLEAEKQFRIHELPDGFAFLIGEDEGMGYIRNILINADEFYKVYEKVSDDDHESLDSFVKKMFTKVSQALDNNVTFTTESGKDGELRVIDADVNQKVYSKIELETAKNDYREISYGRTKNIYEKKKDAEGNETEETVVPPEMTYRIYNQLFPINNFGQDSIVRELNYNLELDSDISNHFFWNDNNPTASSYSDLSLKLSKALKKKQLLLETPNSSTDMVKIDEEISTLKQKINDLSPASTTYLGEYQKSAARTYSKLIPEKGSDVNLRSEKSILQTKLNKILTSSDIVNSQKILSPPYNTPKLPLRIDLTIDGISGIKMYDSFSLTYVPALYKNGHFKVIDIQHAIDGTDWTTKLGLIYVEAEFPTDTEFEG